eukprot:g38743.t1
MADDLQSKNVPASDGGVVENGSPDLDKPRSFQSYLWKTWTVMQPVWIFFFTEFLCEAARGVLMPMLLGYAEQVGGSQREVYIAVSAFSFGKMFGGPTLGLLSNYIPFKYCLYIALCISLIGDVTVAIALLFGGRSRMANVYLCGPAGDVTGCLADALGDVTVAIALLFGRRSRMAIWLFWTGRAFSGIATGTLALSRSAISAVVALEHRLDAFAYLEAARFIGYTCTPIVAPLFSLFPGQSAFIAPLVLLISSCTLCIALVRVQLSLDFGRQPSHDVKRKAQPALPSAGSLHIYAGVAMLCFLNLTARGLLAVVESQAAVIYRTVFFSSGEAARAQPDGQVGEEERGTGLFLTALGMCGLVNFLLQPWLKTYMRPQVCLCVALWLSGVGCALISAMGKEPQQNIGPPCWLGKTGTAAFVTLGVFLIWSVAAPILSTVSTTVYSQLLGDIKQGGWMGLLGASGSVGRIVLPLLYIWLPFNRTYQVVAGLFVSMGVLTSLLPQQPCAPTKDSIDSIYPASDLNNSLSVPLLENGARSEHLYGEYVPTIIACKSSILYNKYYNKPGGINNGLPSVWDSEESRSDYKVD